MKKTFPILATLILLLAACNLQNQDLPRNVSIRSISPPDGSSLPGNFHAPYLNEATNTWVVNKGSFTFTVDVDYFIPAQYYDASRQYCFMALVTEGYDGVTGFLWSSPLSLLPQSGSQTLSVSITAWSPLQMYVQVWDPLRGTVAVSKELHFY